MPYKDPEQKKQWERLHRSQRLDVGVSCERLRRSGKRLSLSPKTPERRESFAASSGRWKRTGRLQSQTRYRGRWPHVGSCRSL